MHKENPLNQLLTDSFAMCDGVLQIDKYIKLLHKEMEERNQLLRTIIIINNKKGVVDNDK